MTDSKSNLNDTKQIYILFLKAAIDRQDWHLVSDMANDLREIEVEIKNQVPKYEPEGWYKVTYRPEKGKKK